MKYGLSSLDDLSKKISKRGKTWGFSQRILRNSEGMIKYHASYQKYA